MNQEIVVPASFEPLSLLTTLRGFFGQQGERNLANERHVLRSMVSVNASVIFVEDHMASVQPVLDTPMPLASLGETLDPTV